MTWSVFYVALYVPALSISCLYSCTRNLSSWYKASKLTNQRRNSCSQALRFWKARVEVNVFLAKKIFHLSFTTHSLFPLFWDKIKWQCKPKKKKCSAKQLVEGEPNVSYICSRYYRAPELVFGATDYTTAIGKYFLSCLYYKICIQFNPQKWNTFIFFNLHVKYTNHWYHFDFIMTFSSSQKMFGLLGVFVLNLSLEGLCFLEKAV